MNKLPIDLIDPRLDQLAASRAAVLILIVIFSLGTEPRHPSWAPFSGLPCVSDEELMLTIAKLLRAKLYGRKLYDNPRASAHPALFAIQ